MIKLCAFSDEAGDSIKEQILALKRNGVSMTEIRSIDGKNVSNFTFEEAQGYQKEFEENGIVVWSIGSPLGKEDINVDFNEYLNTKVKHVLEIAKIFKTDKIRVFSFFNAYKEEQKVYKYLQQMVNIAKEYGVELYHENEKEIFGDTAERVLKIMQNVKGLKYVYDPANYLQVGENADKTLDLLHEKTDYFHIKDVISEKGTLVPAGYGDGKIKELISRISNDKVLTIEPHLAVFDAYKSIDKTEMKHEFTFASGQEAFDAAVTALKNILKELNYKEAKGKFVI